MYARHHLSLSGVYSFTPSTFLHAVTIDVVSVGYDSGETRYKFHCLTHNSSMRGVTSSFSS